MEDITGLKHNTIKQYKWVAENTSSNRLDDISFGHHIEVANNVGSSLRNEGLREEQYKTIKALLGS